MESEWIWGGNKKKKKLPIWPSIHEYFVFWRDLKWYQTSKRKMTALTSWAPQAQRWQDSSSAPRWSQGPCHHRYGKQRGAGWLQRFHPGSHLIWSGPGPRVRGGTASSGRSLEPEWWPSLSPAPHPARESNGHRCFRRQPLAWQECVCLSLWPLLRKQGNNSKQ